MPCHGACVLCKSCARFVLGVAESRALSSPLILLAHVGQGEILNFDVFRSHRCAYNELCIVSVGGCPSQQCRVWCMVQWARLPWLVDHGAFLSQDMRHAADKSVTIVDDAKHI